MKKIPIIILAACVLVQKLDARLVAFAGNAEMALGPRGDLSFHDADGSLVGTAKVDAKGEGVRVAVSKTGSVAAAATMPSTARPNTLANLSALSMLILRSWLRTRETDPESRPTLPPIPTLPGCED